MVQLPWTESAGSVVDCETTSFISLNINSNTFSFSVESAESPEVVVLL